MSTPQCKALAAALASKGLTQAQVAQRTGITESDLSSIFAGSVKPTTAQFNSIASALGISNAPHDAAHATK